MSAEAALYTRERIMELREEMSQLEGKRREFELKFEEADRGALENGLYGWRHRRKCKRIKRRIRRVESAIGHKGDALGKMSAIHLKESG